MKSKWIMVLSVVVIIAFISYSISQRNEMRVSCVANVSLTYENVLFKGEYFFSLKPEGTGIINISGHVVHDGQSYDVLRSFKVLLEPLRDDGELYRITVVRNSVYSSDKLSSKMNNSLTSWSVSNVKNLENTSIIAYIQPIMGNQGAYLISNLRSPVMLCQAIKTDIGDRARR